MLKTTDNQTLLSGVNAVGLVSLLAYTLRTFTDVNNNIDELRGELDQLRKSYSENNKRSNVAFNHLSNKIEENSRTLSGYVNHAQRSRPQPQRSRPVVYQEEKQEDDIEEISTFTNSVNDEISGALSELLSQ